MAGALKAVHAAATWYMAGLIAFVQIVHYPLFARVGEDAFAGFHRRHLRATAWAVGPAMLVEAAAALWIAIDPPAGVAPAAAAAGLALLAAIWASTALVQVPLHRRLARGYDAGVARRLVRTNAVRAVLWGVRAALALVWLLP